jgi:hypothetical protein
MAYIGNEPGVASQRVTTNITATEGQTTFATQSGYTVGYLDVFLNGVKIISGTDYTADDGINAVLTTAASAGDVIELVAYIPRGLSDGYLKSETDALINAIPEATPTQVSDQNNTSTGYFDLPAGTTAQRPENPTTGYARYNSTLEKVEFYTADGWQAVDTPPLITSVSPATINGDSGTEISITGTSFATGSTVIFITTNGTEVPATVVTRNNASSMTAELPRDFTVAEEPLSVKVQNPSSLAYTLENCIDLGSSPTWTTAAGSLGTILDGESLSVTLQAGDAETTVTYQLESGSSLPAWLSLNSTTGVLSGTAPDPTGTATYSFNIEASDGVNVTSRGFSVSVKGAPNMVKFGGAFGAMRTITQSAVIYDTPNTPWGNWNVDFDSRLDGALGQRSWNDADGGCKLLLWRDNRVFMFRETNYNFVDKTGWTPFTTPQSVFGYDNTNSDYHYKDFSAGSYSLDNNSAQYLVDTTGSPTAPPTYVGYPTTLQENSGDHGDWFSPGFYGVSDEADYQIPHGTVVSAIEYVTANTAANARMWLFVMERDSVGSTNFRIRAGWLFEDDNAGDGELRSFRTEDAISTLGLTRADQRYVVPSSGHASTGDYRIGWYSGDPYGGVAPNGSIYADASTGGGIHYTGDDTEPTAGHLVVYDSLNVGRNISIAFHGY